MIDQYTNWTATAAARWNQWRAMAAHRATLLFSLTRLQLSCVIETKQYFNNWDMNRKQRGGRKKQYGLLRLFSYFYQGEAAAAAAAAVKQERKWFSRVGGRERERTRVCVCFVWPTCVTMQWLWLVARPTIGCVMCTRVCSALFCSL